MFPAGVILVANDPLENTRNSVKVYLGIMVMTLVESLICWEVIVTGQGSECHLTFVRARIHIAE